MEPFPFRKALPVSPHGSESFLIPLFYFQSNSSLHRDSINWTASLPRALVFYSPVWSLRTAQSLLVFDKFLQRYSLVIPEQTSFDPSRKHKRPQHYHRIVRIHPVIKLHSIRTESLTSPGPRSLPQIRHRLFPDTASKTLVQSPSPWSRDWTVALSSFLALAKR